MEYEFIKDLNTDHDDWFLKVCIVRLWNIYNKKDEQHPMLLEMMLLDENVTNNECRIAQKQIKLGNFVAHD